MSLVVTWSSAVFRTDIASLPFAMYTWCPFGEAAAYLGAVASFTAAPTRGTGTAGTTCGGEFVGTADAAELGGRVAVLVGGDADGDLDPFARYTNAEPPRTTATAMASPIRTRRRDLAGRSPPPVDPSSGPGEGEVAVSFLGPSPD